MNDRAFAGERPTGAFVAVLSGVGRAHRPRAPGAEHTATIAP